jgi:hypothetical protein
MGDWWPEDDDARAEAVDIINNGQEGLDADGNPFDLDYEEEDD